MSVIFFLDNQLCSMVENYRMDTDIFILANSSSNERGIIKSYIINVDIMVSNVLICYNEKS